MHGLAAPLPSLPRKVLLSRLAQLPSRYLQKYLPYYQDGYPQGRNDQLAMILSTLGKPTTQEMEFLSD
jgi:hypothetical protein